MIGWLAAAFALVLAVAAPNARADGKVYPATLMPQEVAMPDQRALLGWKDGVETLVIESAFVGQGKDFAWVVPLVSGLVVHLFGLRYMATLSGIAFFSHQVGSFVGAWGGGLIYSTLGNYDRAWQGAVVIGIAAGLFQMTMNVRPSQRMLDERGGPLPA